MDKKKIAKIVGVGIAALLIGLSQLGVLPDLGLSHTILDAIGFERHAEPVVTPVEAAK